MLARVNGSVIVFTDTTAGVAASLLRLKNAFPATRVSVKDRATPAGYFSFAYSALASFRMGMSGSASFQRVRNSL